MVSSIFKEAHCDNPDLFTPFVAQRLRKRGLLKKKKFVKMVCFLYYLLPINNFFFYQLCIIGIILQDIRSPDELNQILS